MSRITLNDTLQGIVMKMAEGNPGALKVCMEILSQDKEIDKDAMMPGVGTLLALDDIGVYGPRIWMFFKDVCSEKIEKMLAVMRAIQLGFIPQKEIQTAIDCHGTNINVENLYKQVKKELPNFDRRTDQ